MVAGNFTGRKAQFLNYAQDGIKLRATRIASKTTYKRTVKHKKKQPRRLGCFFILRPLEILKRYTKGKENVMFCPVHGKTDPCPGGVGITSKEGNTILCDGPPHCPQCGNLLEPGLQSELF